MRSIRSLLGWGLLLSFALLAPISLPAGGASQLKSAIRRSDGAGPIFAGGNCKLRASPSVDSPSLRILQAGTPIRVLRIWNGPDGNHWIQVKILSIELVEVLDSPTRGWVNV